MQESTQHNNIHSLQLLFTSPASEIPKLVVVVIAAEVLDPCVVVLIAGTVVVWSSLLQKSAYCVVSGRWANKNQSIDVYSLQLHHNIARKADRELNLAVWQSTFATTKL